MKLKILTANIAFGIPKMSNIFVNVYTHLVIHGRSMLTLFLNPKALKDKAGYLKPARFKYFEKHNSLKSITSLIEKESPDILVLNEVLKQFQQGELEATLKKLGYKSISFGFSRHYDDATVSSLVASKAKAVPVAIDFPQGSHPGGGGGIAALRFAESMLTVIGAHLCYANFTWLYGPEIEAISDFISKEIASGRKVVTAGDWNESSHTINAYPSFSKLNLKNAEADIKTCPTFFPKSKLKPLDHIFTPSDWQTLDAKTAPFGSDHLAVIAEVETK